MPLYKANGRIGHDGKLYGPDLPDQEVEMDEAMAAAYVADGTLSPVEPTVEVEVAPPGSDRPPVDPPPPVNPPDESGKTQTEETTGELEGDSDDSEETTEQEPTKKRARRS